MPTRLYLGLECVQPFVDCLIVWHSPSLNILKYFGLSQAGSIDFDLGVQLRRMDTGTTFGQ